MQLNPQCILLNDFIIIVIDVTTLYILRTISADMTIVRHHLYMIIDD